jgi:hypothetical protein
VRVVIDLISWFDVVGPVRGLLGPLPLRMARRKKHSSAFTLSTGGGGLSWVVVLGKMVLVWRRIHFVQKKRGENYGG